MDWRVVTLCLLGVATAVGTFAGPQNELQETGTTNTELTCNIPDQLNAGDKAWYKTDETAGNQIANNAAIISGKESDYELVTDATDTAKWNLKIKKELAIDDGDKYICKQNTNTGTGRLIVVDVTCGGEADGARIKVYCETLYSGDWKPVFKIKKGGSEVTVEDKSVDTGTIKSRYEYTEDAPKVGDQYACELDLAGGQPSGSGNVPDASAITCSYTTATVPEVSTIDDTSVTVVGGDQESTAEPGESVGTVPRISFTLQAIGTVLWLALY